jgi:hypothetical protein
MTLVMPHIVEKSFHDWAQGRGFLEGLGPRYVFRGHGEGAWTLSTSIERCCQDPSAAEVEPLLRAAFQSACHLYEIRLPERDDPISWLALMQHHRVPTRLIDWTQSPHVAAYFAAVHEGPSASDYSIWAIDILKLKRAALEQFARNQNRLGYELSFGRSSRFAESLFNNQIRCVAPVQAAHFNVRQTNQKGLFLCVGDLGASFVDNLAAMADLFQGDLGFKIVLPGSSRAEALQDLYTLNVQPATLFPGLDGFCDSMRLRLRLLQENVGQLQWEGEFRDVLREVGFM